MVARTVVAFGLDRLAVTNCNPSRLISASPTDRSNASSWASVTIRSGGSLDGAVPARTTAVRAGTGVNLGVGFAYSTSRATCAGPTRRKPAGSRRLTGGPGLAVVVAPLPGLRIAIVARKRPDAEPRAVEATTNEPAGTFRFTSVSCGAVVDAP